MYLKDPKNNKPSVSLTAFAISFILFAGLSVAASLGYVKDTSSLAELFYACSALYFGRRFQLALGNKSTNEEGSRE